MKRPTITDKELTDLMKEELARGYSFIRRKDTAAFITLTFMSPEGELEQVTVFPEIKESRVCNAVFN